MNNGRAGGRERTVKHLISAAAGVNVGKHRANNEDNLYFNGVYLTEQAREQPASFEAECADVRQIYAVCDGMGGEQYGELASLLTVETVRRYADIVRGDTKKSLDEKIRECIISANDLVCRAQKDNGAKRIGTTFALLAVDGRTAGIYNMGDSRVYLLRDGAIAQLSEDHTYVASISKLLGLTPEQEKSHPMRNRLTRYIGIDSSEVPIDAYSSTLKMKKKDIFLLCSDGLSDAVDDDEMRRILTEAGNPAEAVSQLMDAALVEGKDNITVIVVAYNME